MGSIAPSEVCTYDQAQALILQADSQFGLLDVELDGFAVWPLLRPAVADRLVRINFAKGDGATRRSRVGMMRRVAPALADLLAYARLRPASRIFNTHTTSLTHGVEGRYGDVFMHEVIKASPDSLVLETPNSELLASRRGRRSRRYATVAGLGAAIGAASRLHAGRGVARASLALRERIDAAFGTGMVDDAEVRAILSHFTWARRMYGALFRRVRPKQLLMNDFSEHGAIAAARECGCEAFELQHGVLNLAACQWGDGAAARRDRIPVADRMLMFGEYWASQLDGAFWRDRLHPVGSIPVDRARASESTVSRAAGTPVPTVVFTAQGIEPERTAAFLREAALAIGAVGEVVVKLHPVYSGDHAVFSAAFEGLKNARIAGHGETVGSLDLIARGTVHASISSTSHYEAIALGRPTVILAFKSWENVKDLAVAGHAAVANVPADLVRVLSAPDQWRCAPSVGDFYYTRGAVQNILAALDAHA